MNFEEFRKKLIELDISDKTVIENFIENIDINENNFDEWVEFIFSNKISELDLDKLPYVIDILFQTNDKFKFMLCCMLIETTCDLLPFMTNLENYPIFKAKYDVLKNTLITVYDRVDNGIANCMALIMLNNDPKFEMLLEDEKLVLIQATRRKLNDILLYLKQNQNVNELVYNDLEIIIDLSIHLNDNEIQSLIEQIDNYPLNFACKLFITKYKIINNIEINDNEIRELLRDKKYLSRVVELFENHNMMSRIMSYQITQEDVAKSTMIKWLEYPTELGKAPDEIELLGAFEFNEHTYYAYKFKSNDFITKDFMLGIVGGYEKNKLTAVTTGGTFSKFEVLKEDYMEQAAELAQFIYDYWVNYSQR